METIIVPGILGLMITGIGIVNMTGNISTLHWYHRSHVKEEDRLPFGRMIGKGTIIIGLTLIANACFEYAAARSGNASPGTIGGIILITGLALGSVLIIWALFKYNKGIF